MTGYKNDLFQPVHMSQNIKYRFFIIKTSPVNGEGRMRGKVRDKDLTLSSLPILVSSLTRVLSNCSEILY